MPSADVHVPVWALQRLAPWYPAQLGIAGTGENTGLRRHSTGKVLYVDPNFVGVSDLRDGTEPDAPLQTITAALTHCRSYHGDIILVMANDAWQFGPQTAYNIPISESVVVNVHGVSIIGVSPSGALGPVWRAAAAGQFACTIQAMDVMIDGFCFDRAAAGVSNGVSCVWVGGVGGTIWGDNATIRNCFFSGRIGTAIALEYAWNCYIHDCVFEECSAYGIYLNPGGSGAAYLTLHDCQFHNCAVAMAVNNLDESHIYHNMIYNTAAQAGGAATNQGINTTGGLHNMICDNYFSCILPAASPGDWNDFNTGVAASEAWVGNHCMNGLAVTIPT